MTVPVLLIIFNRPELTHRALQALIAGRPEVLLVAADGPRGEYERELCDRTRGVIAQATLDCPLRTDYAETNMGCGVRVRSAIDWALSMYESVIVLEDDCIAAPTFFSFCRELLVHYQDDDRVMHISGNNFQCNQTKSGPSYTFSKYTHAWGWATWRRAWQHNDWCLTDWPQRRTQGWLHQWCTDPLEREYWSGIFDSLSPDVRDIWDYQWMFSCWTNGGLTVIPRVNLVSNVGAGEDATHTKEAGLWFNRPTGELSEIEHPPAIARDIAAEQFTFEHNFNGAEMRRKRSLRDRIRRRFPWLAPPVRIVRRLLNRAPREPR